MEFKITHIQLFHFKGNYQINEAGDYELEYSYSANLIINDTFVVQAWGIQNECGFDGVADPDDVFWKSEALQLDAYKNIDNDDLENKLESDGFENNGGWLEDWPGVEIMNPENREV